MASPSVFIILCAIVLTSFGDASREEDTESDTKRKDARQFALGTKGHLQDLHKHQHQQHQHQHPQPLKAKKQHIPSKHHASSLAEEIAKKHHRSSPKDHVKTSQKVSHHPHATKVDAKAKNQKAHGHHHTTKTAAEGHRHTANGKAHHERPLEITSMPSVLGEGMAANFVGAAMRRDTPYEGTDWTLIIVGALCVCGLAGIAYLLVFDNKQAINDAVNGSKEGDSAPATEAAADATTPAEDDKF